MTLKDIIKKNLPASALHFYNNMHRELVLKSECRQIIKNKYPTSIHIELTNKCNAKCRMCPHQHLDLKFKEMEFTLFEKIISDLKEFPKLTQIVPVGLGEPFLYSRWADAARLIKTTFPKIQLRVATNGILINDTVASEVNSILDKGDEIQFSLNSWRREDYLQTVGHDKFETVISNILNLAKEKKKSGKQYSLQVQLLLTKESRKYKKEFSDFWIKQHSEYDISPVYRELENWGGQIDTKTETTKVYGERYPCLALWLVAVINCHGNVYPCCEALGDPIVNSMLLGNVKDTKLLDLFSSDKYRLIREIHVLKQWNDIHECVGCDFWSSSPNIWKHTY